MDKGGATQGMVIKGRNVWIALVLTVVVSSGATVAVMKNVEGRTASSNALNDPTFSKFLTTYQTIKDGYYTDVKTDTLLNGAIDGMLKSLNDPYTTYMDPKDAQSFQENISSSFEGIGAEIREDNGKIVIDNPIKGSPAEKAGLKPNDVIVKVDGTSLVGMSADEAVLHIRGKKGTKAQLEIQRPGVSGDLNISVVRDTIPITTVDHTMLGQGMGKITISKFAETTNDEFQKALKDLQSQGMKGMILDLRGNGGGLLDQAVDICNTLVPNQKLILKVQYRDGHEDVYRSKADKVGFPVVVLVDGGTASASEITTAALKESAGDPVVGDKTFGKGVVQTTDQFTDGSNIKYTIAKWLTPNGNWIQKKGILPDYQVDLPAYAGLPVIDSSKELKINTFSTDIKSAQQMLAALGYDPGRQDGFFDDKTQAAVIAFQKANNLPQTGTIKGDTTNTMINLLSDKIQKNDTQLAKAEDVLRKMLQ